MKEAFLINLSKEDDTYEKVRGERVVKRFFAGLHLALSKVPEVERIYLGFPAEKITNFARTVEDPWLYLQAATGKNSLASAHPGISAALGLNKPISSQLTAEQIRIAKEFHKQMASTRSALGPKSITVAALWERFDYDDRLNGKDCSFSREEVFLMCEEMINNPNSRINDSMMAIFQANKLSKLSPAAQSPSRPSPRL